MLTELCLKTAKNLGKSFVDQGKLLLPKNGTLLSELVKYSFDSNLTIYTEELIEDSILHFSTGKEIENKGIKNYILSDHDSLIDNYISDLTTIYSNQILFARNVVNKDMQDFITNLETYLSSYAPKEAEDYFNVRYYKPHDIFKSELMSEINSTNKSIFNEEPLPLSTLENSEFNFKEYVKTYDTELDNVILSFISDLEERNILNKYLFTKIKDYELDVSELLEYGMVNYLFYRALSEKTDLNFGLSLMELRSKANANKIVFANKVKTAMSLYETNIRNGKLLSSTSETNFSFLSDKQFNITIFEESFEKLSQSNVPIEAIFGFIVDSNTSDVSYIEIEKNKDLYIDKWNKLKNLYMLNLNKNKINIAKQFIKMEYDKLVNKVYSEIVSKDEDIKLTEKAYKEKANKEFDCFMENLTNEQLNDLNYIGLEVVAESVYWFSNAYALLKEMNDILNTIENITPQEAAMYSAIKYLTNYMLDQVDIVKI